MSILSKRIMAKIKRRIGEQTRKSAKFVSGVLKTLKSTWLPFSAKASTASAKWANLPIKSKDSQKPKPNPLVWSQDEAQVDREAYQANGAIYITLINLLILIKMRLLVILTLESPVILEQWISPSADRAISEAQLAHRPIGPWFRPKRTSNYSLTTRKS